MSKRRHLASAFSEGVSRGEGSLEVEGAITLPLPSLPKRTKVEVVHTSDVSPIPPENDMATHEQQPTVRGANDLSRPDKPNNRGRNPFFLPVHPPIPNCGGPNWTGNSGPNWTLTEPQATPADGTRKEQKKNPESVLNWRNVDENNKKSAVSADTSRGAASEEPEDVFGWSNFKGTPGRAKSENDIVNGPQATPTDGTRKEQEKKPDSVLDWKNFKGPICTAKINGPASVPSQSTIGNSSQAPEYGKPPAPIRSGSEGTPSFGTKSNPVKDDVRMRLEMGLPASFGSGRSVSRTTDKLARAKSSSSERGVIGFSDDVVQQRPSRPSDWAILRPGGNEGTHPMDPRNADADSTAASVVKEADGGCCEAESKDSGLKRGKLALPVHVEPYIDSHCHLDFIWDKASARPRLVSPSSLICRLRNTGRCPFISHILSPTGSQPYIGMDILRTRFKNAFPSTFKGCIANFIRPSNWVYADWIKAVVKDNQVLGTSWGIHPHNAAKVTEEDKRKLSEILVNHKEQLKIVAVGECGVDLSGRNDVPLERQLAIFRFQVDLAYELDLPIIIHCREGEGRDKDPEDAVLNVLKARPNHPIHRHCFTRDVRVAEKWMNTLHNCTFGFTPVITTREIFVPLIKHIPIDRIHLETDAPYFKTYVYSAFSQPTYSLPGAAITVAIRISEITGLPLEEVIRATRLCTQRIYRLPIH